jgi:hypothetical protein
MQLRASEIYGARITAGAGHWRSGCYFEGRGIGLLATFSLGPLLRAALGGRFSRLLLSIDSLQLTARHQVATPVDCRPADDVIIVPALSDTTAATATLKVGAHRRRISAT